MKISKLIKQLEEFKLAEGDLDIRVCDTRGDYILNPTLYVRSGIRGGNEFKNLIFIENDED